jgi:hypothetical protein
VRKPNQRPERKEITMFAIYTPLPEDQRPEPAEGEEGEDGAEAAKDPYPPMTKDQHRWVLGPKETKKLYVKFFSTKIGTFQ